MGLLTTVLEVVGLLLVVLAVAVLIWPVSAAAALAAAGVLLVAVSWLVTRVGKRGGS